MRSLESHPVQSAAVESAVPDLRASGAPPPDAPFINTSILKAPEGEQSPLAAMMAEQPLAQPDWALFHNSLDCWNAIFEMCEEAAQTIQIEQYIFCPDGVGGRLVDLLTRRAREGVDVRILADGFGSNRLKDSPQGRALQKAGGRIVMYNGLRDMFFHRHGGVHRLHRKLVLTDRTRLIAGGCCYHDRMEDWRDTMVRIEGAPVPAAVRAVDALWRRVTDPAPVAREPAHTAPVAPGDWAYMVSTPYRPAERELYQTIVSAIEKAQASITLTTPYLVPDIRFLRAMTDRLGNGVRVRLIVPDKSDHPFWNIPARIVARRLAERGAEIYAYEPAMIHAKIAVIDDDWASVGSTNLDLLSFALNLENGVISRAPDFHAELSEQLERDLAVSRRL